MMNMETLKLDVDLKELHTLTDFIGQYSKDLQAKLVIEEIFVNIVNYSNADYIIVNVESHKNLEIEFVLLDNITIRSIIFGKLVLSTNC